MHSFPKTIFINKAYDQFELIKKIQVNKEITDFENDLGDKINILEEQLYANFNYSILSGEYLNSEILDILEKFDIEKLIKHFEESLESTTYPLETISSYNNILKSILKDKFESLINAFKFIYKKHVQTIQRIQEGRFHKIIYNEQIELPPFFQSPYILGNIKNRNRINLFSLNIQLAYFDHKISVSDQYIRRLLEIRWQFQTLKEEFGESIEYLKFIESKINILLVKSQIRDKKNNSERYFFFDNKEQKISDLEIELNHFQNFKEKAEKHYLYDKQIKTKELLKKEVESIHNNSDYRIEQFHQLIKFYKDINPNIEQLNYLAILYKECYIDKNKQDIDFNKYAYRISYLYILNNLLSLTIKNDENYDNTLSIIEAYHKESTLNNYFPYYKLFERSINILESLNDPKEIELKFEKTLNDSLKYYSNLRKSFKWAKENDLLIFQLPYNECLTEDITIENHFTIKLFLASSFIVPIDYQEEELRIEEYKTKQYDYLMKHSLTISTNRLIETERKIEEKTKERIEKNQLRSIEIIGLFAAIISLVIGSVKILEFVKTFTQGLFAFIGFGATIGFFMIILYSITNKDTKNNRFWENIIGITVIILITIVVFTVLIYPSILTD